MYSVPVPVMLILVSCLEYYVYKHDITYHVLFTLYLNYNILYLSKHIKSVTIKDLKSINAIVWRIKERDNVINYTSVDDKDYLKVRCISDVSYLIIEK